MTKDESALNGCSDDRLHGVYAGVRGSRRRGGSYVWLLYSAFLFIDPILQRERRAWLVCLGHFAVLLVAYTVYLESRTRWIRLAMLAVLFAQGLLAVPTNSGATFFFIFVGALLPFALPTARLTVLLLAGEALLIAVDYLVVRKNPINFGIAVAFTFVVGISNLYVAEQKRAENRLRAAQEENLALAALAERERIARDLHDVLGHTLSVIVLKAELAGRLLERDAARAAVEISEVERTARTALAEVREAIGGYRTRGLRAELEQARRTLDAAGVSMACESAVPQLPARQETVLSLAVREAVTNIVRHAGATECTLRFGTTDEGFAQMELADNGRARIEHEGDGLRGMRERVQELGGQLRIESGAGTRLTVEIPQAALHRSGL